VRKGKNNEPPIKGFSLTGAPVADSTGAETTPDLTSEILSAPKAILVFITELPAASPKWKNEFSELYSSAAKKGIPFYIITKDRQGTTELFSKMGFGDAKVLSCDFTAIRTAARVSPTLYLLQQGNVEGKWSYANFDDALSAIHK
jgi:hypothetical protein